MPEGRPQLVVAAEPAEPQGETPESRSTALWLLVALTFVCLLGFAWWRHEAKRLGRELAAAQVRLADVSQRLAAEESLRREVHGELQALSGAAGALADRLSSLEARVGTDLERAADAQPERSSSPSID